MRAVLDFVARAASWLMAPLYAGLLGAILLVVLEFGRELFDAVVHFPQADASAAIVMVLRLISLVLIGQLAWMMCLAGMQTLKPAPLSAGPDIGRDELGTGSVRVRIVSVMVAIGAVDLLEVLLGTQAGLKAEDIFWKIMILVAFVVAGVLLVVMERIAAGNRPSSA